MDALTQQIGMVRGEIAQLDLKIAAAGENNLTELLTLERARSKFNNTLWEIEHERTKLLETNQEWSWRQWIDQPLPFEEIQYGTQGGSSNRHRHYWPRQRTHWIHFATEVACHRTTFEAVAGGRSSRDFMDFPEGFTHGDIRTRFVEILQALVRYSPFQKFSVSVSHPTEVGRAHSSPADSGSASGRFATEMAKSDRRYPDMEVKNVQKRVIIVGECKRPMCFRRSAAHPVPDLVVDCTPLVKDAIRQLTKYMLTKKVGYGILTSEDITYFVKFEGKNWVVSEGVTRDSIDTRLLAALHYVLYIAKDGTDIDFDNYGIEGSSSGGGPERGSEGSGQYETRSSKRLKMQNVGENSTAGAMDAGAGLEEVNVSDLNMTRFVFATGSSGKLSRGHIKGQPVVIKLAPAESDRGETLQHEARVYLSLRPLWGYCIPHLVRFGTTVEGTLVYLATEYIEGLELNPDMISEAVTLAARQALSAIHSFGVLHGDLHPGNILVVDGDVRLIDFGMAEYSSCKLRQEREMDQLKDLLAVRMHCS